MFTKLTMGRRLTLGFSALVVAAVFSGAYSAYLVRSLSTVSDSARKIYEFGVASTLSGEMLGMERAIVLHSIFDNKPKVEAYKKSFEESSRKLGAVLDDLRPSLPPEKAQELLQDRQTWMEQHSKVLQLLGTQQIDVAEALVGDQIAANAGSFQATAKQLSEELAEQVNAS